jgi:hypothetical protein
MPTSLSKCCFVVSQIGDDNSRERIHADWFLEAIVEPTFEKLTEFKVERADKLSHPGLIDAQVIHKLLTAEIVIADLTGLNPNVFYEIGIRHMAQEPIIHMHETGQSIPFDVSLYRSIAYSRLRPSDLRQARSNLAQSVDKVLAADYQVENPITNVRGRFQLELHATPEQKLLIGQLRSIEEQLASLEVSPLRTNVPTARLTTDKLSPDYISFYSTGDYVKHHKFGTGSVVLVDGAKLTVDFPGGQKRVIDDFVELARRPE